MTATPSIVVLGGNSRLARSLRQHLPDGTRFFARKGSSNGSIAVADYQLVGPDLFAGATGVISCVGIDRGDRQMLHDVNVVTPLHLVRMARASGVERFVHVSSFSVFGGARHIVASTAAAPTDAYGESKLAAEHALLSLTTADFAVVAVRLPAIIGGGGRDDKLARLIRFWSKLPTLPVPRRPVRRSMISVDLAARVLQKIVDGDARGVVHAADPVMFTYAEAADAISSDHRRPLSVVELPDPFFMPLRMAAPGLFASMYEDSLLTPSMNVARDLPSDLYQTIASMAGQERRR